MRLLLRVTLYYIIIIQYDVIITQYDVMIVPYDIIITQYDVIILTGNQTKAKATNDSTSVRENAKKLLAQALWHR